MLNPEVAKEIGKLPDLHDGISSIENQAIEKLIKLYTSKPTHFVNAFNHMNKIGKPEIRKYCAPLQAFFWRAEKDDIKSLEKLLEIKNIKTLLAMTWNFYDQKNGIIRMRLLID